MLDLSSGPKKAVALSALGALIVAVATVADLIFGYPFAGYVGFDILFLLCAANVMYLAYDTWRDLAPRRRSNRKHSIYRKPVSEQENRETKPPVEIAGGRIGVSRFAVANSTITRATPRWTEPSKSGARRAAGVSSYDVSV